MEDIDNKEVTKSRRESFAERLSGKYPDKDFTDDEALFGQISDDYDDYDNQLSGYQQREKTLNDMFSADPRSAAFLNNWRNGDDPVVALVRQFGTDIKDAIDDPERQEEIAKANAEFLDRVAENQKLEEEFKPNLVQSLEELQAFKEEKGLTDEMTDKVFDYLVGIVADGLQGKYSRQNLALALNALNHDQDVATAAEEGEVRGKNAKVEAQLRKRASGDGTAALNGANGTATARPRPNLGALGGFGEGNTTIWERGGEKRRSAT